MCRNELTILEPTATPKLKVNLSLTDTVTAVTCSAALPTIGSKITPTNSLLINPDAVKPSIESTRNSAVTATNYSKNLRTSHDYCSKHVPPLRRPKAQGTRRGSSVVAQEPQPMLWSDSHAPHGRWHLQGRIKARLWEAVHHVSAIPPFHHLWYSCHCVSCVTGMDSCPRRPWCVAYLHYCHRKGFCVKTTGKPDKRRRLHNRLS